jgi:elongation factor P
MSATSDISKGLIVKYNNEPHVIIEKEFCSMGKGGAFNRVKLRNIKSGKILSDTWSSNLKVEVYDDVFTKTVFFSYIDGSSVVFMDPETFEQYYVNSSFIDSGADWLHQDAKFQATFQGESIIYLQIPTKLTLKVIDTPDAIKGDTVNNNYKDAILETGAKVKVPMFIKNGDMIIVNTETREYFSKA